MEKSYNLFSEVPFKEEKMKPFIKLDNNEVKIIREAMKICNEGDKFAYKICEEDEFREQIRDFRRAKMYLHFVLSRGNIYYYKKRKQWYENFSRYMRTVHKPKNN